MKYVYNQKIKRSVGERVNKTKVSIATAVTAVAMLAGSFMSVAVLAQGGTGGGGSATGGGSSTTTTTTTSTGGGGSVKAPCDPFSGTVANADINGITASYTVALCVSGKTVVNVQFKNPSGLTVLSVFDPVNNQTYLGNIVYASDYTVMFTATNARSGGVIGSKTITVTTPTLGVNCATGTTVVPRMGYYLTWAAVWINYSTLNCGYGMQTAEVRITNLDTGVVTADYKSMPTAMNLDYEGPAVAYDTNYQFDVIIHGAMGEVLDSASSTGRTVPLL